MYWSGILILIRCENKGKTYYKDNTQTHTFSLIDFCDNIDFPLRDSRASMERERQLEERREVRDGDVIRRANKKGDERREGALVPCQLV